MSKAVMYILLTAAFLLLLTLSPRPQKTHNHLPLSRRFGLNHASFDPLVWKAEILKEQATNANSSTPILSSSDNLNVSGAGMGDFNEYLNDAGKLNITLRLFVLFPLLDTSPKDGFADQSELENWNVEQAIDRLFFRTKKHLLSYDQDGDRAVSLKEYLPHLTDEEMEKDGMLHGEAGWWKEQFANADTDRDGTLNFDEFNDFLHPEDSKNKEIQKWLLREKIKQLDSNSDGKLSFEEFRDRAYDTYRNYFEFENGGDDPPSPEEIFAQLDLDKDRVLEADELRSIMRYLYPGEVSYAQYYTKYLIYEADDNKDGKLSLEEMLNHELLFYSTVVQDGKYDYDYDDDYEDLHDEL
ncbi:EF-hand domain [Dillenia turbinata]|uniref:EF-hand domain n=1 Tax=Dillenia turbinata TaxID=194707 RepID=A0AAN8V9F3_9MAGN